MESTKPTLSRFPTELILEIDRYLPPDANLALRLSCKFFMAMLGPAPRLKGTTLSDCADRAIRTYLAPPVPEPSHIYCVGCGVGCAARAFESSNGPACRPMENAQETDVVELPRGLCSDHVSRLVNKVDTEIGGRNEWVSYRDTMCMHCTALQRSKKCHCNCDSCPFEPVTAYIRYLNNDREYKGYQFRRQAVEGSQDNSNEGSVGQLWVREGYKDPSKSEIVVIKYRVCSYFSLTEAGAMGQKLYRYFPVHVEGSMPE